MSDPRALVLVRTLEPSPQESIAHLVLKQLDGLGATEPSNT
jgi:hypothetical protein